MEPLGETPFCGEKRVMTTGGYYSYLKIAEGCDKHCTYCIIPRVRGRYRSIPMDRLVDEAGRLAAQGVKELILVAQETTLYGLDLYGKKMLPELLERLCGIQGLVWIRILYCYPEEIDDALIQVMRKEEKICHYLDIPVQHASDSVLKRMGRRTDRQELTEIVNKLRQEISDICLRTTLIAGFPGETEEDFEETLDVVRTVGFDSAFTFIYSRRTGTPAASMENQIPEDVVKDRFDRLLKEVQDISGKSGRAFYRNRTGGAGGGTEPQMEGYMTGRLGNNHVVHFPGNASMIGKILPVRLEECRGFLLYGNSDRGAKRMRQLSGNGKRTGKTDDRRRTGGT